MNFDLKYDHPRKFRLKCPYCGFEETHIANNWNGTNIVYCSAEDGGCDRKFAYEYEIDWIATAYQINTGV